jgi:DNA-binding CsgD family transcriptional regulator
MNRPWSQSERNAEMIRLFAEGQTFSQLAKRYGIGPSYAREIVASWYARNGVRMPCRLPGCVHS